LKAYSLKQKKIISALIICFAAFLSIISIHKGHNWGGDFSLYISQAISLNSGEMISLYNENKATMDTSEVVLGPYLYPYGFPILLSFIYSIFGLNFVVFKLFCTSFFIASLFFITKIFKATKASFVYLFILITISFNYKYLTFSDNVLSDFPFMFFSLLSIYLIDQKKTSIRYQLIMGSTILFAYMIRDIGIILLFTLFFYQLSQGLFSKRKKWITLFPYFIFLTGFILIKLNSPNISGNLSSYVNDRISLESLYNNSIYYAELLGHFIFPLKINLHLYIGIVFIILTAIGMYIYREKYVHFIAYSLISLGVYIIWPSQQGLRFLFPILPFLLFFFFECLIIIFKKLHLFKYFTPVCLFYLALLSIGNIGKALELSKPHPENYALNAASNEMMVFYDYIKHNTNKKDLIVFFRPRVLRLFTERKTIFMTSYNGILESKADYVIEEKNDPISNKPKNNGKLELICETQFLNFYLVNKD